jgi:hypothetical protein
MDENGGPAGRGERGGDLTRHEARLAHAGDNDAARRVGHRLDGLFEGRAKAAGAARGQRRLNG